MSAYLEELNELLSNNTLPTPTRVGQRFQVALEYGFTVESDVGYGPVLESEVIRSLDFRARFNEANGEIRWVCVTALILEGSA